MSSKCIRDTVNKVKTKYQESDPYRLAAAMHIIVKSFRLELIQTVVKASVCGNVEDLHRH